VTGETYTVNGKWIAFIQHLYPRHFTVASHSHINTPMVVPTNTSGAVRVRVRSLAQGHLDTSLGGARGSNQQPSCWQTRFYLLGYCRPSLLSD